MHHDMYQAATQGINPVEYLPYLLGGLASLALGWRSWALYKKLHTPITRHFALTGLILGIGFCLHSVPFIFTSDNQTLAASIAIGRIFLDLAAVLQVYLVWYLTPLRKTPFWPWFLAACLITLPSTYLTVIHHYTHFDGTLGNKVLFPAAGWAILPHVLSLVIVIGAGSLLLKEGVLQRDTSARLRLVILGMLYILIAGIDIYNSLTLGGINNTTASLMVYIIAAISFVFVRVYARGKQLK